jgi:hypothetical protein
MDMSGLVWSLIVWAALTTGLIILLIYRSLLTNQEDEQLFLDKAQSQMQRQQLNLQRRVKRVTPLIRALGGASAALILAIAGTWLYQIVIAQ